MSKEPGAQVREFKEMVRALHAADIEVILDVVFNHTAEGNEHGPTLSFKGLENRVYYMLENGGQHYRNYTGCGNTLNGNHPIVREMIFDCLRHWVHNYHVDGFRFDLASILSRDRDGNLVPNPPVVETISEDPQLADTKIIAEAWDAAGAYQVGTFGSLRWAEWNGRYRDDVRRFWRGDPHMIGPMATRLAGSSDLYQASGRRPYHSINFITSHDGFTLNDLVSYNWKHNEANGEGNRDGDNNNYSCNYGHEGPTHAALDRDPAGPPDQEPDGHEPAQPGRADDRLRRRVPADAARQQQRLLPGQCDFLVRLAAGAAERGADPLRAGLDRLPPPRADDAADRLPHGPAGPAGRSARRELVRSLGRRGRLVARRQQPDVRLGGRAAEGLDGVAQPPFAAHAARRRGAAEVRLPQDRAIVTAGGSSSIPARRRRRTFIPTWTAPPRRPTGRWNWRAARWSATLPATNNERRKRPSPFGRGAGSEGFSPRLFLCDDSRTSNLAAAISI